MNLAALGRSLIAGLRSLIAGLKSARVRDAVLLGMLQLHVSVATTACNAHVISAVAYTPLPSLVCCYLPALM